MTTSIERLKIDSPIPAEAGLEPSTSRPTVGQKVPEDPGVHAMRGVLWSVTVARVVLIPVFLVGATRLQDLVARGLEAGTLRYGLMLVVAVIAASDVLDGWLARRYGLTSRAGTVADALADKTAQVALVGFFTFSGGPPFASLPLWFFVLVLGRDLLLGGGWLVLRAGGVPFEPVHRMHGRAANAGVFLILLWLTLGLGSQGFTAFMLLTGALIWVSLASYLADAWEAVRWTLRPGTVPSTPETGDDDARR